MDELDKQAWDIYIKKYRISEKELEDSDLCLALKNTVGFSILRLSVALNNLVKSIISSFKW